MSDIKEAIKEAIGGVHFHGVISITYKKQILFFGAWLFAVFCVGSSMGIFERAANAHGGGGGEDKVINGYLIDFGYDPEMLMTDEQIRFTLAILDNETQGTIDFENAWVRVAKGEDIFFASTLARAISNDVSFLYNFRDPGAHEVTVRFQKYSEDAPPELQIPETLIETTFIVDVMASHTARESRVSRDLVVGFVLGMAIGGIVMFFIRGKRKEKSL